MGRFKIWKVNISGTDRYVATDTREMENGGRYKMSKFLHYNGPGNYSVYNFKWKFTANCETINQTEIVETKRVNYNHVLGNKIIIRYSGGHWPASVKSYTDDFLPASNGAIYEFNFPSGEKQILTVGETPEGWESPFTGRWWPVLDGEGSSASVSHVSEPVNSSFWVDYDEYEGYYVTGRLV